MLCKHILILFSMEVIKHSVVSDGKNFQDGVSSDQLLCHKI